MPVRRSADPISVQHVWDAVRAANGQRQMADLSRIVKYLQRIEDSTPSQAELHLQQALSDGLIVGQHKVTAKGSKAGTEVESYRIPIQESPTPAYDGYDWYCIDCHLAGDVITCSLCHRVFHAECAHKNKNSFNKSPLINLNSLVDKKKTNYVPIINSTPHNGNNDVNLNRLVDDVERKLEKMEDLVNVSSYTDPLSDNANPDSNVVATKKENGIQSTKEKIYNDALCSICNMSNTDPDLKLEKEELNHLLTFVHSRVRTWVPVRITDTVPADAKAEWLSESEVNWRATQLFYQPMNMPIIEAKLQANEYTKLFEFKADILTVQHNVAIYHGIESQEQACAEFLWKDCQRELSELSNCVDCYKHSNEKINNKWFCFPCRVPHKLVWAKQKGYPYWPAKVLRETADSCDVRFFGGKYERSVLAKAFIKPISITITQQIKKTSGFNRAVEELRLHQRLLDNPTEVKKYTVSRKRRVSTKTPKNPPATSTPKPNPKKRSRSVDISNKDVYDFENPLLNLDQSSSSSTSKKKRPSVSSATREDADYSSRSAQSTKRKNDVKNGAYKESSTNISTFDDGDPFVCKEDDESVFGYDGSHQEVSSSTEHNLTEENTDGLMPQTERQHSEAVEKMRRRLEQCRDKKQLIKVSMECMQAEIDRIKDEHEEYLKKIFETHSSQISETKKKQWCYNCEQDAIYHCCWNTAYCSPTCQQQHWQAEHKKVCRRKR